MKLKYEGSGHEILEDRNLKEENVFWMVCILRVSNGDDDSERILSNG
jgi:hypothetical protein